MIIYEDKDRILVPYMLVHVLLKSSWDVIVLFWKVFIRTPDNSLLTVCSSGRRTRPLRAEWQLHRQRVPQGASRVWNDPRVLRLRNHRWTHQRHRNDLRRHLRSRMFRILLSTPSIAVDRITAVCNVEWRLLRSIFQHCLVPFFKNDLSCQCIKFLSDSLRCEFLVSIMFKQVIIEKLHVSLQGSSL